MAMHGKTWCFFVIGLLSGTLLMPCIVAVRPMPQEGYDETLVVGGILFGKYSYYEKYGSALGVLCDKGALKLLGSCLGCPLISLQRDFTLGSFAFFLGFARNGHIFGVVMIGVLYEY
ncbi:MAG: hypothetical protein JW840_03305 [Candidatus Thermoplasmatota archaeon]|nr:hypothetical protein [Candidatus Thermoplasmatota archaeon]